MTAGGPPAAPELSIIVVSWNTRDLLGQCLASVFEHLPPVETEVWVVDNASADGSAAMVRRDFPAVRLIENDRNLGFAAANCQAVARATGKRVLLLNSDTVVKAGALEELVAACEGDASIGIAGAKLVGPDGALQPSCTRAPTPLRELVHLYHLDMRLPGLTCDMGAWDGLAPREVDVVQGACMLVRRDVLDAVGCLDDGYFMYSEEVELCDRARRAGWKVVWIPTAEVVHFGGASTAQVADEMFMALFASKCRFFRRNRGTLSLAAFKLVLLAAAAPRVAGACVAPFLPANSRARATTTASRYLRLCKALPGL